MENNVGILVVDDDKEIADLVEIHLVGDGYTVYKANDATEGLSLLKEKDIKLAILDIMMPGIDGLTLCKKIRETSTIPIIMLSAKSTDLDKIIGLSNGADDYVIKPFNPLELTARVKSQLRRYTTFNQGRAPKETTEIALENLTINKDTHRVVAYGKEVKLTPIEFDILYLLAGNPGKVFSTEDIFEQVWNEKMYEANNTVMVHIRRLREKIELDSRNAQIIKTVWGVGYKIEK
jgi:DNA-binding response OmpR family regulator